MKKLFILLVFFSNTISAQVLSEGFDNVAALYSTLGWWATNNSNPSNANIWYQDAGNFTAYSGAANSSITTGWYCTDNVGVGDASNWVFTPPITVTNGDTISFYTISYNNTFYQDRVEVRMNVVNSDTLVGASDTSVGHYTHLVVTINPTLSNLGYPLVWTKYTSVVSGFSGGLTRLAFRYFVPNTGGSGTDGSIVGIDDLKITAGILNVNALDVNNALTVYPNPASSKVNVSIEGEALQNLTIYQNDGKLVYSRYTNSSKEEIDLTNFTNGIYTLNVQTAKGSYCKKLVKTN